jgi:hypothetical protein
MNEPRNSSYCNLPNTKHGLNLECNRGLCCRKYTEKVNIVFNINGTVSYQEKNSFQFVPEKSGGRRPNQDYLTVPSIPLLVSQLSNVFFVYLSNCKLVRICVLTVPTKSKKQLS